MAYQTGIRTAGHDIWQRGAKEVSEKIPVMPRMGMNCLDGHKWWRRREGCEETSSGCGVDGMVGAQPLHRQVGGRWTQ